MINSSRFTATFTGNEEDIDKAFRELRSFITKDKERNFKGKDGEEAIDVTLNKQKKKLFFKGRGTKGEGRGPIKTVEYISKKYKLNADFIDTNSLRYFSRFVTFEKGKKTKEEGFDYSKLFPGNFKANSKEDNS